MSQKRMSQMIPSGMRAPKRFNAALIEDESITDSIATERSRQNWYFKKPATFHQAQLKVHYKAIARAISDKRNYKMTDWRA